MSVRRGRTTGTGLTAAVTRALLQQVGLAGALVFLVALSQSTAVSPGAATPTDQPVTDRAERIISRLHCSRSGLPGDAIPSRSVVRPDRPGGRQELRVTSFDRGWASYTGERPGTLVAVCP